MTPGATSCPPPALWPMPTPSATKAIISIPRPGSTTSTAGTTIPQTGRFINADDAGMLGGDGYFQSYNLFAYCGNNPVSKGDIQGDLPSFLIGAVVGAAVGGLTALIKGDNIVAGVAQGAVSGLLAGAAVDVAILAFTAGSIAAIGTVFIGGVVGNILGEETSAVIKSGHNITPSWGMVKRSIVAGSLNTIGYGFSATLGVSPDFSISADDIVSTFVAIHLAIIGEGIGEIQ